MVKNLGSTPNSRKNPPTQKTSPSTSEISDSLVKKMDSSISTPSSSKRSESEKRDKYFESLPDTLNPPEEELQFRRNMEQNKNFMEKHTKVFKCTKCSSKFDLASEEDKLRIHPCLGVLFCKDCIDYYESGDFSLDDDGEDKYCRWCGEGGMLFGCSKCICGFCLDCIKRHFGVKYLRKVKKDNDWLCFLCNPKRLWTYRYVCSLAVEKSKAMTVGNSSPSTAAGSEEKAYENSTEDPGDDSDSGIKDSVKSSPKKKSSVLSSENSTEDPRKDSNSRIKDTEKSSSEKKSIPTSENSTKHHGKNSNKGFKNSVKSSVSSSENSTVDPRKDSDGGIKGTVKSSSEKKSIPTSENSTKHPGKNSNKGLKNSVKSSIDVLSDSDSSTDLEIWSLKRKSNKETGTRKKRIYSSSSDESENKSPEEKKKKLKLSAEETGKQKRPNFDKSKELAVEKLEKVLKLSQQQMTLGVNWSSKMLKKFSDPKRITAENLKDECQKVKCFLSVMSKYLLEFCNSVEAVETTLMRGEGVSNGNIFQEQMPDLIGFSAVLQFLSFINNQVNTFMEKGLSLPDILQAEIYDDDNVIGLRKNVKSSSSSTSNESLASNHSKATRRTTSNEMSSPPKRTSSLTSNESLQVRSSKLSRSTESPAASPSKTRSSTFGESLTTSPSKTRSITFAGSPTASPSKTRKITFAESSLTASTSKSSRSSSEVNHQLAQQSSEVVEVQVDDDESRDEDSLKLVVDESSEPQDANDDMTFMNSCGTSKNKNSFDKSKHNKDLLQILEILENA